MKKMMNLWMNLIVFPAFISAYTNPVDCDIEVEPCRWSIEGFIFTSNNELNSTDGRNDIMHIKDRNFLDGLCSWQTKESNVPTKVNNAVTEFKSTKEQSVLTSGFVMCPGEKCLSFKYQMKDFKTECILIEVRSYAKLTWSLVWKSQSQHQMQGWNEINVTINVEKGSNIAIRFQHGNCSNVTYNISSISLKYQSCTESATKYRTSPSAVLPTNSSKHNMTSVITTKHCITTIVKHSSADLATSTAATSVNTSSHYAKDGVIIGIAIGGLAFTIAVLLIATYLYS
ncbi:hypothetical protein ACJMK2_021799 [Sinanodonta woodiana]|uniref:MAM domain-containing protein n=1 Tax=Sinanodonta woodiana TaxID=1069815 RepID=A0ABD3TIC7_SINWO